MFNKTQLPSQLFMVNYLILVFILRVQGRTLLKNFTTSEKTGLSFILSKQTIVGDDKTMKQWICITTASNGDRRQIAAVVLCWPIRMKIVSECYLCFLDRNLPYHHTTMDFDFKCRSMIFLMIACIVSPRRMDSIQIQFLNINPTRDKRWMLVKCFLISFHFTFYPDYQWSFKQKPTSNFKKNSRS